MVHHFATIQNKTANIDVGDSQSDEGDRLSVLILSGLRTFRSAP